MVPGAVRTYHAANIKEGGATIMRSILAVLILGAVIFTGPAAFASVNDSGYNTIGGTQAAVTTGVGQIIVVPADSDNVGVVSGPDQVPPGPSYNQRIENKEN
jgi:hypothetical protein